jgi:hypothetical protein
VRAFFDDVRAPLLPEVLRERYARAKTAFDEKDFPAAAAEFDRVIRLLDEMGPERPGAADLRTLATSFRDLTALAMTPPPRPAPSPEVPVPEVIPTQASVGAEPNSEPAVRASGLADPARIYGTSDVGITRPIAIVRPLPPWQPQNNVDAKQVFRGVFEVIIDEAGNVIGASMRNPVHPAYDGVFLKALREWKFRPATKDGMPVRFRYTADINLGPQGQ